MLLTMAASAASKQMLIFQSCNDNGAQSTETPFFAFDGNVDTKYCSMLQYPPIEMPGFPPVKIRFNTVTPVIPAYYNFWSANDANRYPYRSPRKWVLRAKDGENWIEIDRRDGHFLVPPSDKKKSNDFIISILNRKCYQEYELEIQGLENSSPYYSAFNMYNPMQFSEFELYGSPCSSEDAPQVLNVNFAAPISGNDYPGYMMLLWMSMPKVDSMRLYENNQLLTYPEVIISPDLNQGNSGVVFVKASEEARTFRMDTKVNYDNDTVDQRYFSTNVFVPAYHIPHSLSVAWYRDSEHDNRYTGKTQIGWKITNPGVEDVFPGDAFIVERDTTAGFATATSIGMVMMDGDSIYSFIDETPEIQGHAANNYYYRVRRATTSVWSGRDLDPLSTTYILKIRDSIQDYNAPYQAAIELGSATPYADWATSRRVQISAQTYSDNNNKYYWDKEKMPAYLVRYMVRDGDTTFVRIPIPADSIKFVPSNIIIKPDGTSLPGDGRYRISFTDELEAPCTKYHYAIWVDHSQAYLPVRDTLHEKEVPMAASSNFYYNDGMRLISLTVSDGTSPDFNSLVWETKGGFDRYEIWRNDSLSPASGEWKLIETVHKKSYIDRTAPIGRRCLYKVVGVEDCDILVRDSLYSEGYRDCYGTVSGQVTYPNGTANAGVTVEATTLKGDIIRSTTTDEAGKYTLDSLYFQEQDTIYFISVRDNRQSIFNTAAGTTGRFAVSLNGTTAIIENIDFINTSFVRFSGRVLYEYSTVPVPRTQFVVNGHLLLNPSGEAYETDASGNFELMVPSGLTTVQAVKKGHTFQNNGYFVDEQGQSEMLITSNIYGQRIYDQTKVRLIGRLTGGMDEGQKTLGFGQSVNTLGDNLTLVLELEGDNTSRLVYHPTDLSITQHDTAFYHITPTDSTTMQMTPKRITIHPDVRTGEYQVELFPVKYKIVQATATGYSTLLPGGTAMPTLDLTDVVNTPHTIRDVAVVGQQAIDSTLTYHETYSITYRTPVVLHAEQIEIGTPKDYFGEKSMEAANWGDTIVHKISILRTDSAGHTTGYLFGHPVFSMYNEYVFDVSAREHYYYNGDVNEIRQWHVDIKEGDITIYNGLKKQIETLTAPIHPITHKATFNIAVDNASFVLQGENALRQVEMRMNVNGLYVYGEPIRGFVSGMQSKGVDAAVAIGTEVKVLDVIRDPYGSGSYAYVEAGTTYDANYNSNGKYKVGLSVQFSSGSTNHISNGLVAAPMGAGTYTGMSTVNTSATVSSELPINAAIEWYSNGHYSFTTSEMIRTSSDPSMVGAKADVYIGTTYEICAEMTDAVAMIDSTMYRMMQPAFLAGKAHLLAQPDDDSPYYLVVGEQVGVSTTYPVRFAHSQHHIINVLLPKLIQERNALIQMDDSVALQTLANATKKACYGSLVPADAHDFGLAGKYRVYYPAGGSGSDEIALYNQSILRWLEIIYDNELTKVQAPYLGKPLNNYTIDAGTSVRYSETGSHSGGSDGYFNWMNGVTDAGIGLTKDLLYLLTTYLTSRTPTAPTQKEATMTEFDIFGVKFNFRINPILESSGSGVSNVVTKGGKKTTGFELVTTGHGYEEISVYRLTDEMFKKEAKENYDRSQSWTNKADNSAVLADFVFYRRGGATRCPYEGGDSTILYGPGGNRVALGVPTVPIDVPTIQIDRREISNVPQDQPATFVLTLSNESGVTSPSTYTPTSFVLSVVDNTNPNGLRVMMDGTAIRNGANILLAPGQSIQKTIQVYRGTAYDYEDVSLALVSGCDPKTRATTKLSVHYQPNSCPVALSLPVQNWVMNTLSPRDTVGYYLPVEITGFDVNYDGFDHIDLQYKLQTQSDDQWITQCSYYADSALYNLASGNKAMIENGEIKNIKFYGERDPIEQKYDLRAVSFCRFGNGFLTRSSDLRSGLKDTRVPQLFGVATPARGILQVGDYISVPFSEPIAANYLDEDFNFEITGYTNASGITPTTSLHFPGTAGANAMTQVRCNLNDRDFTIDMMVMPDDTTRTMCYFSQGSDEAYFTFGQYCANGQTMLAVHMGDQKQDGAVVSRPVTLNTRIWSHVVMTYNHETGHVDFYLNGERVNAQDAQDQVLMTNYAGLGLIMLGDGSVSNAQYRGRMLEVRVWGKVLNLNEVRAYNNRQLTGYETNLIAYYPLSEGKGNLANDKGGGATMVLNGLSWNHPEGKSLTLNNQTLRLAGEHFPSDLYSDFTYTMWFRLPATSDTVSLLHSACLKLRLTNHDITLLGKGHQETVDGSWMDNEWHMVAISSNQATGVGLFYMDGQLLAQVPAANYFGPADAELRVGPMTGTIDDITYWNMALPANYLKNFYQHTPNNRELGLITHLGFSERVLSDNGGVYSTVFCPYNQRERRDDLGNIVPRKPSDRVVKNDPSEFASNLVDNAPIRDKGNLVKLGFSWIGRDNELVINLKTTDREINKQNIFVTVRGVEDLAGNPQKSPMTWTLFVDRNRLRWSGKYLETSVQHGESTSMSVDIINQGGTTTNYYIQELPWWLTASSERGEIAAQNEQSLRLRVSDKLNPGAYHTVIYLVDDDGLAEPLRVDVSVLAKEPEWKLDNDAGDGQTMGLFGRVMLQGTHDTRYMDTDTEDLVAAYMNNFCLGVEHISTQFGQGILYMNLHDIKDSRFKEAVAGNSPIYLLLWRASTGKTYLLRTTDDRDLYFRANTVLGTPDEPIELIATDYRTQGIDLVSGWNWISFFLHPYQGGKDFSASLLNTYTFSDGDLIKCRSMVEMYEYGWWQGPTFKFDERNVYMAHVAKAGQLTVHGATIPDTDRNVMLKRGWNYLPYLCEGTQTVEVALADYLNFAKPGDVVKSYTEFSMLNSKGQWIGSLTHMHPGKGYMLYRQNTEIVQMHYQDLPQPIAAPERITRATTDRYSNNMPIVTTVEGAAEGDILRAYAGNELVGEAVADAEGRFLMLTHAEEGSALRFEYDNRVETKTAAETVVFRAAAASAGTVEQPMPLHFTSDMATAYPSPFVDHIVFSATAESGSEVQVMLYDVASNLLWQHQGIVPTSGQWLYTMNEAAGYQKGVYIAIIRVGENTTQVKLIKQ